VTKVYLFKNNLKYNCNVISLLNIKAHIYTNASKQATSYTGWWLLFEILKRDYNIDLITSNIRYNSSNKPYIDNIYFNISNSSDLIAIIISDEECSVDIEWIKKDRDIAPISKRLFSKLYSMDTFYKKFTILEANYKYSKDTPKNMISKKLTLLNQSYYLTYCYNGPKPIIVIDKDLR
jgi:phosphopantetheinyl transferase